MLEGSFVARYQASRQGFLKSSRRILALSANTLFALDPSNDAIKERFSLVEIPVRWVGEWVDMEWCRGVVFAWHFFILTGPRIRGHENARALVWAHAWRWADERVGVDVLPTTAEMFFFFFFFFFFFWNHA